MSIINEKKENIRSQHFNREKNLRKNSETLSYDLKTLSQMMEDCQRILE